MRIAIVGSGYVGLVSGTCFAEMGIKVTCIDTNPEKIERLQNGKVPIYEPELDTLIQKNMRAGRLSFGTDLGAVVNSVDVVFIAVGTPPDEDGGADLSHVLDVAKTFGASVSKYTLLVTKSTVPVGTAAKVRETVERELAARGIEVPFDVASNPDKSPSASRRFVRQSFPIGRTAMLFVLPGHCWWQ